MSATQNPLSNGPFGRRRRVAASRRRGVALLICMVLVAITSLLVIQMLDTQTVQWAAERNTADYERALYLAGAGAHHALAELEADPAWRGTVTDGAYPGDDSYSATAVAGAGGDVVVTATGVSGESARSVQVTVSLDG